MITDGDKKSSDHLSLAAAFALRRRRQHVTSPRWLLTRMAVLRFMVAECFFRFPPLAYRRDRIIVRKTMRPCVSCRCPRRPAGLYADFTFPRIKELHNDGHRDSLSLLSYKKREERKCVKILTKVKGLERSELAHDLVNYLSHSE